MSMEDKIIIIATYPYSRALLLKGQLEAEGIECFLSNINLIQPHISSGVKVKINEKDLSKALKIIDEIKKEYGEARQTTLEMMKRTRRILVPVDFSESSVNACSYAVGLAAKLKAEIKLLYSYFNPIVVAEPYIEENTFQFRMDEIVSKIEPRAKEQMHTLIGQIKDHSKKEGIEKIKITYHLDRGMPEEIILRYAEVWKPGVIVMGTKGTGRGAYDYIGSVTKKIITKAGMPILVVPQNSVYRGISYIGKILYATNFDDSDLRSLRTLIALLSPFDVRLYCAHTGTEDDTGVNRAMLNNLKERFQNEYSGYNLHCDLIHNNDIVQGLEDYIEDKEIDLLALTTHKRGIIERLFNPSLARQMLFHTHIPLLVFQS